MSALKELNNPKYRLLLHKFKQIYQVNGEVHLNYY